MRPGRSSRTSARGSEVVIGVVVLTFAGMIAIAYITGAAGGGFTWRRYARQHAGLVWRDPGRWRRAQVKAERRGGR